VKRLGWFLILMLFWLPVKAEVDLVEGGEHRIDPDTVFFLYDLDRLRCGALFDPLPWDTPPEPASEVTINPTWNWGCQNPYPYPGPDAAHPEVVVLGNTAEDGSGETVTYLIVTLELRDATWVTPSERQTIRDDPERAIRIAIHDGLQNRNLRLSVDQNENPHAEVSDKLYAPLSPDSYERVVYVSEITWLRLEEPAIETGFEGYPWLESYSSDFWGLYWIWRAKAQWMLVLRGRAHGHEPADLSGVRITLSIDELTENASGQSLRVIGGRLRKPVPDKAFQKAQTLPWNGPQKASPKGIYLHP